MNELSALTTDEEKDKILMDIATAAPHKEKSEWESMMWHITMRGIQREALSGK